MRKHYKDITCIENSQRLVILNEFRDLVKIYFENSNLNMISGQYIEKQEAIEARASISLLTKEAYELIRLADIKTYTVSNSLHSSSYGRSMDIILNIFNLDRNNIPLSVAIDYIERAIDVYKANRIFSFIRTINPFYWLKTLWKMWFKGQLRESYM
ncbi:MAG: hypothetical protein OEU95_00185 [Nitrospirota bacterium]|nr:hypothetical protein [Nitrospirota bacterium]